MNVIKAAIDGMTDASFTDVQNDVRTLAVTNQHGLKAAGGSGVATGVVPLIFII